MNNWQTGDTIFYRNMTALTSKIQQVVLKTDLSHCSYVAGLFDDSTLELEADVKVRLHTFLKRWFHTIDLKHRQIFRWNPEYIDPEIVNQEIRGIKEEFEGEYYGFIQWPTIFIRVQLERLGFKNAKKWNILWGWGYVCSELLYYGETRILERHYERNKQSIIADMLAEFKEYNPDTFTPVDLRKIYLLFPELKMDITEQYRKLNCK